MFQYLLNFIFVPSIETHNGTEKFLPASVENLLEKGEINSNEVIIGVNRDEWCFIYTGKEFPYKSISVLKIAYLFLL